jgi:N-acetylmuramoyl-L-alanine amidase
MNMKRIVILILSLLWLLSPVTVFAENSEQAYQKARDAYYSLQDSSRKQMYRENWENVFDKFESVYQRFPKTRRGSDSLYMCGKTICQPYQAGCATLC